MVPRDIENAPPAALVVGRLESRLLAQDKLA